MTLNKERDIIKIAQKIDSEFKDLSKRLSLENPWNAYVAVRDNRENKDIEFRIGSKEVKEDKIVDWRHPIAKYYYSKLKIGETIEFEKPFKQIQGAVSAYASAKASNGNLIELNWQSEYGNTNIVRLEDGKFIDLQSISSQGKTQIQTEYEKKIQQINSISSYEEKFSHLISLLTKEQYELITQKTDEVLIIEGKAGSGKTSVALLRVSWLLWNYPDEQKKLEHNRVLIIMHNKSLNNFILSCAKKLNLEESIEINYYSAWAKNALENVYKGQLEIISKETMNNILQENNIIQNDSIKKIKSHIGLSQYMEEFVKTQAKNNWLLIEQKIETYDEDNLLSQCDRNKLSYVQELIHLKKSVKLKIENESNELKKIKYKEIYRILQLVYDKSILYKEELLDLLCKVNLLKKFLPDISENDLKIFSNKQRLIQQYQKNENAKVGRFIEEDDVTLLLRLIQLKRGGLPYGYNAEESFKFDHVVIDEAQDFGSMQLQVLLDSVNSRTGVTIAGDINQKISPECELKSWENIAKLLKLEKSKVTKLDVVHRSSVVIMWLADSIINNPLQYEGREGEFPKLYENLSSYDCIKEIRKFILQRTEKNPNAHICVVLKNKKKIDYYYSELVKALPINKISLRKANSENEIQFKAGVSISEIQQIKGLEFDSIIVPDVNEINWPDTQENRSLMYIAISRAQEDLLFLCKDKVTPILNKMKNNDFWNKLKEKLRARNFKQIEINIEELNNTFDLDNLDF